MDKFNIEELVGKYGYDKTKELINASAEINDKEKELYLEELETVQKSLNGDEDLMREFEQNGIRFKNGDMSKLKDYMDSHTGLGGIDGENIKILFSNISKQKDNYYNLTEYSADINKSFAHINKHLSSAEAELEGTQFLTDFRKFEEDFNNIIQFRKEVIQCKLLQAKFDEFVLQHNFDKKDVPHSWNEFKEYSALRKELNQQERKVIDIRKEKLQTYRAVSLMPAQNDLNFEPLLIEFSGFNCQKLISELSKLSNLDEFTKTNIELAIERVGNQIKDFSKIPNKSEIDEIYNKFGLEDISGFVDNKDSKKQEIDQNKGEPGQNDDAHDKDKDDPDKDKEDHDKDKEDLDKDKEDHDKDKEDLDKDKEDHDKDKDDHDKDKDDHDKDKDDHDKDDDELEHKKTNGRKKARIIKSIGITRGIKAFSVIGLTGIATIGFMPAAAIIAGASYFGAEAIRMDLHKKLEKISVSENPTEEKRKLKDYINKIKEKLSSLNIASVKEKVGEALTNSESELDKDKENSLSK